MVKLKHNKLKNTGLFFEILTSQMLHETLNPERPQLAYKIIRRHFKPESELLKELNLYRTLSTQTNHDINELLSLTLEARQSLNNKKLNDEKYQLIKSLKKSYDLTEFFTSRITNYKLLGSIYKLFEYKGSDNPDEYLTNKKHLLEYLNSNSTNVQNEVEKIWINEDPDVRTLGFKLIVEKFNDKYSDLSDRQKVLLSKFINEDITTPEFKDYIVNEVQIINKELKKQIQKVDDPVVKIKLDEVVKLTNHIQISKLIKEEHLSSLLKYYELIEELK